MGSLDFQGDISVYLSSTEIKKMHSNVVEGAIIKLNKLQQQGKCLILVNDNKSSLNGYGIGVVRTINQQNSIGNIELFVNKVYYEVLNEKSVI